MLRRALGICLSGWLLLAAPALAQDDPDDAIFGPSEEDEEDTGPDYAREGFYIHVGVTYGIASKLEDKLNNNKDKFQLAPANDEQILDQRPVPFRFTPVPDPPAGTPPGLLEATPFGAVNPQADGPCTNDPVDPCQTTPLRGYLPSNGNEPVIAPLADLLEAQVGGTIRVQPTPGLRPGRENEFLDPRIPVDIYEPDAHPTVLAIVQGTQQLGDATVDNSPGIDLRLGARVLPNFAVEMQLEYMTGFEVDIPNYSQTPPPPTNFLLAFDDPVSGTPQLEQAVGPPVPAGTFVDGVPQYVRASDTDKINVELLNLTVNMKVPILTGRVQPFFLLGGGVSFVFRDNDFPKRAITPSLNSSDPYRFVEYVDVQDTGAVFRIGGGIDTYVTENIYVALEGTWVATQGEALNDLRYGAINMGVGYRF